MTVYTQPALDLAPAPTAEPTWADVFAALDQAGVQLERQPRPGPGAMQSHTAEWWAARPRDDSYVWVQVLYYRRIMRFRWQVIAYCSTRGIDSRNRVLLHDPTPAEALAALGVLGVHGKEVAGRG